MNLFKIKNIFDLIFVFILVEITIGGGGRFTEIYGVTLRMILFGIAIIYFIYNFFLLDYKISFDIILITISFTFITFIGLIVALMNNSNFSLIFEDIKPLIFFYIILFFCMKVKNINDVDLIIKIFKKSSLFLSLIYFFIIYILLTSRINVESFYLKVTDLGEVAFRDGFYFFYKGFIFLCIGYIFFLTTPTKYKFILLSISLTSIFLTFTRGFILFTILITIYHFFLYKKNVYGKILFYSLPLLFLIFIFSFNLYENFFGNRDSSDSIRIDTFFEVVNQTTFLTFFIGHGFGNGVPTRPTHMEISFLEIFHKQGIFAVLFWCYLFFKITINHFNLKNRIFKNKSYPFFLGSIFILLQSFTNPYMNNPIGLSFILISFVVTNFLQSQKYI